MSIEKPTHAVIETGHHYTLKDVIDRDKIDQEIELANEIAAALQVAKIESVKIVLIDDTRPKARAVLSREDESRWRLFIERDVESYGSHLPDDFTIWNESDVEFQANKLIAELQEKVSKDEHSMPNTRLAGKENDRIKIGKNRNGLEIMLRQKIRSSDPNNEKFEEIPSCPVLDVCVYKEKLSKNELAVTILRSSFKEQQEQVKMLFGILGEQPNVIVVYRNDDGTCEIDVWNESLGRKAADVILTTLSK